MSATTRLNPSTLLVTVLSLASCFAVMAAEEDYALQSAGATVKVSSELRDFKGKSYLGAYAIDGEIIGRYWCTDFRAGARPPHWIELDLGEVRSVGRVRLHMYRRTTHFLRTFKIEAMVGEAWRLLTEAKDLSTDAAEGVAQKYIGQFGVFEAAVDPPVQTRRLKVTVRSPGIARLHEIQVLAPAVASSKRIEAVELGDIMKFDFGTVGSPVGEAWAAVSETLHHGEGVNYGWVEADGLIDVDRMEGYPVVRDLIAGITQDRPAGHTFRVRVPNGNYAVAVLAGDLEYAVTPFSIAAEGRVVAARVGTGDRGGWDAQTFSTEVTDGALDLTFRAEQAWAVCAVVAAPLARFGEVQAVVEQLEDEFAKRSPRTIERFRLRPPAGEAAVATPGAEARRFGYDVFAVPMASMVFPTTLPGKEGVTDALRATATPGEFEPITFAVRTHRSIRNLRVNVGDLSSAKGSIPGRSVRVGVVRCWPQVTKKWRRNPLEYWVVPELIEAQGRHGELWLRQNVTRQFWLTLETPENAGPGTYTGTVTCTADGVPVRRLTLSVEVLPFRLRWPAKMARGIYYDPSRVPDDARVLSDLRDMRSNDLNMICLGPGAKYVVRDKGGVRVDFTSLQRSMRLLQQAGGFTGPFPLYTGGFQRPPFDETKRQELPEVIRQIEAERRKQNWPEFLYYPVDEPFRGERLDNAVHVYKAAKKVPNIRTYCTISAEAGGRLGPWLDVRTHSPTVVNGFVWPAVRDAAIGDGDEFWFYTNCTRSTFDVMRMKAGFFHWKIRATGQTYWHYRGAAGSPFSDFDSRSRDHIVAYPGLDGPIRTVQWECHREGLDDAKYAYTLERLLEEAKRRGVKAKALNEAERVLANLDAAVNVDLASYNKKFPAPKYAFHFFCDWSPGEFDEHRATLVRAMLALQKAMGKE